MSPSYLEKILNASVYDVAIETPLDQAPMLSRRLNNNILLKREDLQAVFSFKLRGSYNKISQLTAQQQTAGVITASAGNHAQGVALAAQRKQIRAVIVMPKTTPQIKVDAVKRMGGEVVLHGNTYDDASEHARELEQSLQLTYIHPYDDPDVIAGQGTIGIEILRQQAHPLNAVFIPVGGGGLIAGVSAYIKHLRPEIKIIGVESEESGCLHAALKAGERVILDQVGIFADGVAVRQIGQHTYEVAKHTVDEVIMVNTDEICAAIKDIFDDTRAITEPAGALAVAGMKKYVEAHNISGQTFVGICSGANMNFDRLRHVSERAALGEHGEAVLAVTIPEKPGSFRQFCHSIGQRGITEFNYRYADSKDAHIFVGVQLKNGLAEKDALIAKLQKAGYPVLDMWDNELAKIHIRYMVGGHASQAENERLYRFQFPERPGALLRFLTKLGEQRNISMFHYRNHGADYGRVLVGIQVTDSDMAEFETFLEELSYPYWNESDNPAYHLFLK
ncbi:MAG: threonine ammonia-lyase, biosynthetic [Gammaproteobacteria bacterium]|nr:threonine ammonia-lyase, biosynthetic [Gammaproteobacteria bacterium]MDH5730334.1 threonine ammonia-lyase, biosynthetic [Gammaproteobacteria bacterium]